MSAFTPRQLLLLALITVVWGLNWPIMKLGVQALPPITFRMLGMWLAVPVLVLAVWRLQAPWTIPRSSWPKVAALTVTNMLAWHCLMIVALPLLSSGRAAILGYTMPIFAAVVGSVFYGDRLVARAWLGIAAAACGVALLLWHETASLGSQPAGVWLMLAAAAGWSVGTQWMRRAQLPVPLVTLALWMVVLAAIKMTALAWALESPRWKVPDNGEWLAIAYNGVLAIGFAQVGWFVLARSMPPVASGLSVMLIPVIGVFSGALWLSEVLHWQDWSAVLLMVVAIGSVLWPARAAPVSAASPSAPADAAQKT